MRVFATGLCRAGSPCSAHDDRPARLASPKTPFFRHGDRHRSGAARECRLEVRAHAPFPQRLGGRPRRRALATLDDAGKRLHRSNVRPLAPLRSTGGSRAGRDAQGALGLVLGASPRPRRQRIVAKTTTLVAIFMAFIGCSGNPLSGPEPSHAQCRPRSEMMQTILFSTLIA